MNAKYTIGQKVRIIFIQDQSGELKYPKGRKYLNNTARVIDYTYGFGSNIDIETPTPTFFYTIRIDKHFDEHRKRLWEVPEEALEPA